MEAEQALMQLMMTSWQVAGVVRPRPVAVVIEEAVALRPRDVE